MTLPSPRSPERCQYPGCPGAPVRELCKRHATRWGRIPQRLRDEKLLPNDGVFDWTAVEVAAQGAWPVRLSWAEREVAVLILYMRDVSPCDIRERLGFFVAASRWQKIRDLAGVLDA